MEREGWPGEQRKEGRKTEAIPEGVITVMENGWLQGLREANTEIEGAKKSSCINKRKTPVDWKKSWNPRERRCDLDRQRIYVVGASG